jgi:putative permease
VDVSRSGSDLYRSLAKAIYLATGLFVFIWFLYRINLVLLAALLALILAVAINAPVTWLERKGWSRGAGTGITFLGLLAITSLILWGMVPRLAAEVPQLIEQLPALVDEIAIQLGAVVGDAPELREQLARLVDVAIGLLEGMWPVLATVGVFGLFILAMALYMVLNLRGLLAWYVRTMPVRLRAPATRAFARSSQMVIGWVLASVIIGLIKSFASIIFLTLIGVPGALLWAMLAFFGAFIPRVGFYIMAVPPAIVAFGVSPVTAVWTLLYFLIFSEILGNFIAPRIFAETMRLDAVFVLFMMLAMGYAFGVIGVLIAAPIAGIVKAYYDEFYLAQQPEEPRMDEKVQFMLDRGGGWPENEDAPPADV